jgi:hypothetical protein
MTAECGCWAGANDNEATVKLALPNWSGAGTFVCVFTSRITQLNVLKFGCEEFVWLVFKEFNITTMKMAATTTTMATATAIKTISGVESRLLWVGFAEDAREAKVNV